MDEEAWRNLCEKDRQALLAKMKLEQRKLRKELYGDEWLNYLKSLEGDNDALRKAKDEKRAEFQRLLALKLARNRQKTPKNLIEIEENEISEEIEEKFTADWVKLQIDDEAWRRLSEKERQSLLTQMRLEQQKIRKELYGEDWLNYLKTLDDEEEAIEKIRAERRAKFQKLLSARLFAQKQLQPTGYDKNLPEQDFERKGLGYTLTCQIRVIEQLMSKQFQRFCSKV